MICSVEGCGRAAGTRGWCGKHYARWLRHGDVNTVKPKGHPGRKDEASHVWRGDDVSYTTVHKRLRRIQGAPGPCECGEERTDWAYDHNDPNEKVSPEGWPYSTDPAHYVPLCRSCHVKNDKGRHRATT